MDKDEWWKVLSYFRYFYVLHLERYYLCIYDVTSVHTWCISYTLDPNRTGHNRAPSLLRSNMHSLLFNKVLEVLVDSTSSTDCINIHPISSALQSIFKNEDLSGSNLARSVKDAMVTFSSSKSEIRSGV